MLAHERRSIVRAGSQRADHGSAGGRIAQTHGEVARPALETDAVDGAAGHALTEPALAPREQVRELRFVESVAYVEIRLAAHLRVAVPGAGELAVVASIDAIADQWPQFQRNGAFQLDGE